MNNFLDQNCCVCLNVQNRIKLCREKNHKFGDETTVLLANNIAIIYALLFSSEICKYLFSIGTDTG